ncbi:MAG: hypothetical protein Q8N81_03235, partial [bacterium]|nr:hypothetical protein [bacterium]
GDFKITQAAMFGTADAPYTSPPLSEKTVAILARLLFLTPAQVSILGYFLFPFILAIIFYSLFWSITRSKAVAALAPLAILLASSVAMDPRNLLYFFSSASKIWADVYNRPIHPQVSSIYFYGWLLLFHLWSVRPTWLKTLSGGVLLGLLFYVYPFSWTVAVVILGITFIFKLWQKDRLRIYQLFGMGAVALLVSSVYWLNTYQLATNPLWTLMKQRFVIFHSHQAIWSNLLFLDLIGLGVFYFFRRSPRVNFGFLTTVTLSLVIVINQQVITGIRMFPGHWHWYYAVPWTIFLWIYFACELLKNKKTLKVLFVAAAAVFIIVFGYATERSYYLRFKDRSISYQRYVAVYDWLSGHAPAGSVVLADDKFSERLPIFAPLYHYTWQGADELYAVSNDQIKRGFFVKIYLQGAVSDNLDKYINASTSELQILLSGYYRRYADNCDVCYTQEEIKQLQQEYRDFLKKDFEQQIKQYKIDYAVWDEQG